MNAYGLKMTIFLLRRLIWNTSLAVMTPSNSFHISLTSVLLTTMQFQLFKAVAFSTPISTIKRCHILFSSTADQISAAKVVNWKAAIFISTSL